MRRSSVSSDDAQIVAAVLSGDRERYADLVERHHRELCAVLACCCGSVAQVEELAQDAFVRAYDQLGRFDASRPFFPWLRSIALNHAPLLLQALLVDSARCGAR